MRNSHGPVASLVRRTAIALLALTATAPVATAEASGGTYDVVFCSSLNRSYGGEIDTTNAFAARSLCGDPSNDSAFKIDSAGRATEGRSARVSWGVEPPLGIVGVSAEGRLRRADGYSAKAFMADAEGRLTQEVANGTREPSDFRSFEWQGTPQRQFVVRLECAQAPSCEASEHARAWVRDLRFTVVDLVDPEVSVAGSLFDGGWHRGSVAADVRGLDSGAGISSLSLNVGGVSLIDDASACNSRVNNETASSFTPCLASASSRTDRTTDQAPFDNGLNIVNSCASDFAGNKTCLMHEVRVDNELPIARFALQDPDDPELFRVPVRDEFSGLATGSVFFRGGWRERVEVFGDASVACRAPCPS